MEMNFNSGFEGEACYSKDDDENIDPDIALSYIDEKLQHVLGHIQKDFEGVVSAENLGAKYGMYGSFLPTYERSALTLSRPKTTEKNYNTSKSSKDPPLEGASRNVKDPTNAPPIRTKDSHSVPIREDSRLPSAYAAENSTRNEETLNRSKIPFNQNALKFRFKVPQNKFKRNAAIYSGLGLDDSPSSSLGDSPEKSGVTPCTSQGTMNESPTNILQVMTTFQVPGGVLLSPLHESLLCLFRRDKEMPCRDRKVMPHLNDSREHSSCVLEEPVLSNIKASGQKKKEFSGRIDKLVESRHKNGFSGVNDKMLLVTKESENEITAIASEVTRETTSDGIREGLFCSNLTKPDSSESIAGTDSSKSKKWKFQICSGDKGLEERLDKQKKDVSVDPGEKQRGKAFKTSDPSKRKEDQGKKIGIKAGFHTHEQINMPFERERPVPEGNKSKGNPSAEKTALSMNHTATTSNGVSLSKNKIHKLKLKKGNSKVRNNHGDLLGTGSQQYDIGPKDATAVDFETEWSTYGKSQKEMLNATKADNQLLGTYAGKAPSAVSCATESVLASQGALAAVAPIVVNDNWVCCDICHKWRLLPPGKTEQLPEKWLCSMLDWLPGMNSCDFSEDETTRAVNETYQILFAEGQANLQNNGNGTLSSNATAYLQDCGLNNPGLNFQAISSPGKKNLNLKENPKTGGVHGPTQISVSKKRQLQESNKSRGLNKKAQSPLELNAVKIINFLHNEEHTFGGESKQIKLTSKRGPDHYAFEGSKKNKKEDVSADGLRNSGSDRKRVGFDSSTGLPIQTGGKQRQKLDECSNSEDVMVDENKGSIASVLKANQVQVSADGSDGILDRMDNLGKKRKLKDGQEIQNGYGLYVEDNIESGSRKEKKPRVSKSEVKQSGRNDADDVTNRRVKVDSVDGAEKVKGIGKAEELLKHRRKNASQKPLDGLSSSIRQSVTGHVLRAATSSSSKVSDSHKTRGNFEEPKDSPVESVSSSPMRISKGIDDAVDGDVPGRGNGRRCWNGQGTVNLGQPVMEKEVKVFSDVAKKVTGVKDRPDDRVNGSLFFSHGPGSDSALQFKGNKRSSVSKKMMGGMLNEQVDLHPRKSTRHILETDTKDHSHLPGAMREDKLNMVDGSGIKSGRARKISKVGRKSPLGQFLGDCGMGNQLSEKELDELDAKSAEFFCKNQMVFPKENAVQDFSSKSKVTRADSESNLPESFSHCEVESKQDTEDPCRSQEVQRGVVSDIFPGNKESPKVLLKQPANSGTKSRAHHNVNQNMPNLHAVRGIDLSAPGKINSSGQMATDALEEAKILKDRAEMMKTSSFGFESNEAFFDAALKFLRGASLLETSGSESGRHCEINQVQAYSTAAKLCESCGQEYEKRGEMAAAALAYKCMEVAFMRIVFCKHSTCNRDRKELQTTISMVPQVLGESPSSSVSDLDNLNNHPTAEKATISKGAVSLVSGNQGVARNRSSFVRLLDFTQDVVSAMEALTKSKNAFEAAKLILEDAGKIECITSVRKVIDFSFHDIEGLICLVQLAKEAICRSDLKWC